MYGDLLSFKKQTHEMPILMGTSTSKLDQACREFLIELDGQQDLQFVRPYGIGESDVEQESLWFVSHGKDKGVRAIMNIGFLPSNQMVLTTLAAFDYENIPDVGNLLKQLRKQLQLPTQRVVAWVKISDLPMFLEHGFVVCSTRVSHGVSETLVALSAFHMQEEQIVNLRNTDGSNPNKLSVVYLCSAKGCMSYGHHICQTCHKTSYCSEACCRSNQGRHVNWGCCRPPKHITKKLFD